MGADQAATAQGAKARPQNQRRSARNAQCDPLYGAQRRWLAHAANEFRPVANALFGGSQLATGKICTGGSDREVCHLSGHIVFYPVSRSAGHVITTQEDLDVP